MKKSALISSARHPKKAQDSPHADTMQRKAYARANASAQSAPLHMRFSAWWLIGSMVPPVLYKVVRLFLRPRGQTQMLRICEITPPCPLGQGKENGGENVSPYSSLAMHTRACHSQLRTCTRCANKVICHCFFLSQCTPHTRCESHSVFKSSKITVVA